MLEGLVATLLNRFLGMYVKNFNAKDLQVGIWSGEVKLKNLELRREALDQLHLPVNVVEGHIGNLKLNIPLSNLRGKPVQINIEDVFLLAAPKQEAEYDEEEEKRRAHAVKMEKLESAELLKERNAEGLSQEEQKKSQSFTESLVTAIVDNLQISIRNIHLRYEDSIAAPGHPFALGVTLKELSAVSTDENWTPTFIQSTSPTTHKLATLGSLAVYWNTDTELFGTGVGSQDGSEQQIEQSELIDKFLQGIDSEEGHQYMLKPVSGRAGIEIDKTGEIEKPKIKARLLFNELGFVLDDDQYRDALMMVDLFHYFIRHQEYKKYQPKESRKENPRAWIKFAGQAVLDRIQERNRKWTWEYMKERKDKRNQYIDLFKKKKKEETLTSDEVITIQKLEENLTYEDLRFWRSLARNQLRKENIGVKKAPQKQTWGQWIWGSGGQQENQEEQTELTEEERQQLMEAIDFDEKKALSEAIDVPRETIKLQVESSLRTGSFALKRDPHGKNMEILNLIFDDFQAKALKRPDSTLVDVSLGGLRLYDGTTPGSLFPQIVKVKDAAAIPKDQKPGNTGNDVSNIEDDTDKEISDKLFYLLLEQRPLDESADTSISLKLRSFEIIYNPRFVVEIARFFKPPERHMESIGALMETAGATVEGIRQQTRAGLEFALQEHKTINAQFDIRAPLIIVPESVLEESTNCLILDAGHASLNSELIDKKTLQEIRSKQKSQYSEADYLRLENLMYDKFSLKLDSTQVLIGPGIDATKHQLEQRDESNNYHIVDRINMDFLLELSILPKDSELTKTRVSGNLPKLHASISDSKYKNLLRLIEIAVPKFDDESTSGNKQDSQTKSDRRKSQGPSSVGNPITRSRSKSFPLPHQSEDLVIDEDEDENAKLPNQRITIGRSDVNLHQRNFEFKFTVEKLQGSLYKSDSLGKNSDQLLVELVAEHFHLDFYQRPFDMVAEVVLRSLVVEDYVEDDPTPEFKNIVSSQNVAEKNYSDLVTVKFIKVQKTSPEFESVYDGISINLDVAVSTINVVVTRRTLLTLLDFILITFTNPGPSNSQEDVQNHLEDTSKSEDTLSSPNAEPDRIRVKAELHRIALVLNNDGIRLATLSLSTAHVGVSLAHGTMRVDTRLGDLSLLDDVNQGATEDSSLRRLVAIEGDELADFKYQTFDSTAADYPGYDSKVYLRSGSLKVNFLEEPFRKIIAFLVKFGQMQAIFNAARQAAANQANQMQERANKMHFDVLIKTPILVFPRAMLDDRPRDLITAYLGEIYAKNQFTTIKASRTGSAANKIGAGIRNIRLISAFHYGEDQSEELELIDRVDLDFKLKYIEHEAGLQRPDMEIEGAISPINLRISQAQTKFLLELSRSIPRAFSPDPIQTEAEAKKELPRSTVKAAKEDAKKDSESGDKSVTIRNQAPELEASSEAWTKLDLTFKAPKIGLELINADPNNPVGDVSEASLSMFSVNDTSFKVKMLTDGSMESELLVHSFTIRDSRSIGTNKYRKVMSLINDDVKQQLMASFTMSGGIDRHLIAMVTLDSPKVIFAMDYIFEISKFAAAAFAQDESVEVEELEGSEEDYETESTPSIASTPVRSSSDENERQGGVIMSIRVNVEDAQVILIANPTITNSEAIVLGTKQVLFSQQNARTLQITRVGMFLCRMDKFDTSRLRILDDFSITMSMENRSHDRQTTLTSIHIDTEPLVLRLSLRDILLATQIVNKASAMTSAEIAHEEDNEPEKLKEVKATSGSTVKRSAASREAKSVTASKNQTSSSKLQRRQTTMRREEMQAEIHGIRVILIGDLHELPLIDWSVKEFVVDVRDWSTALTGDTNINTYINVYNFSKSAWEPLIEPWQLGFHMAKEQHPDKFSIELFSHKNMELTISSATIALASKSAQFLSTEEDVLSKPRGSDAPYRIRNYTGFDLDVWAASREEDGGSAAKLSDGEEIPWRFEDAVTMRESLSPEGNAGIVGVRLQGSGFDSVQKIQINREGEVLYNLKPKQDRVQHRLLVEVKLGSDNVKYITFRSPLLVENNTQIPIEIGVFSPEEGHLLKIEKIAPGEGRPSPVGAAFKHSLVVRPDQGFGYAWSNERLFWKDLLKRSTRTIACHGEGSNESPPFFFQMNANYDKNDPMTSVYPFMKIKLSAPIELQNLLPYDFKYRIYDKNTGKDWTNFLRKGGISPIHVVELSHLLLLSVELQDTVFKQSEFAVINSTTRDDFKREMSLPIRDDHGSQLNLKLHYYNLPDSGGAFKISVYSPYLILNKTGLPMNVQSKAKYGSSRNLTGIGIQTKSEAPPGKAMPYMFSHSNEDRKNRALLRIGESEWSKPQSFDAIGSSFEVLLPSRDRKSEMHIGIHVAEGEGKYNLTKVITIAPRFIIKNKIERFERGKSVPETIQVREPGSSAIHDIKPGDLLPLRFLRQAPEKQICLCFPGVNNSWTSAFSISSVGTVHVKIAKAGQKQDLVRAEVIMEDATLFIHLSIESKHWPFSMRNESEISFMFWQTNPSSSEDEDDRGSGWRPIRYRLPKRSVMPYAWDFPAARNKEIAIIAYDSSGKERISKERRIKLAEIGNLMPLKTAEAVTVDLNIVAEGPSQTLVISKWRPQMSLYRQKTGLSSQATGFEVKDLDSDVNFKAEVRFRGIGVSLINQQVRELLYLTLRDLELKYHDSRLYQTVRATVKWIQIDNQLYGGIFPIILYPSVVPKTGKEMEAHPIFHAQVTRVKDDSYGVLYIKYATLLLQQMTVEIDEDFIFAMLDFTKVPGASWTEAQEGKLTDDELDVPEPTREQHGQDVYFETLHLQPVQIDLSFVRTERINAEDTVQTSNPIMFFVNVMTMSIGNVNDAPLRFNALLLENARISVPALVTNIRNHYTQEALRQVHVILGSADFLGNPVGLFNNISSGVVDIFYEPYQGLVMTDRPQELGIGIAKGASSFVKKSVFGFSDSMAKFTGSMSKGLAAATLDKEYQDQRRMSRARNRPKHALYGVTSGGNAFASSLASGIGGLARHPLEGAEQEGFGGFVKGVGKGFLGLATKPAIGAFDLASNLAEGVRNTTTVFDQEGLDRVRLTRFIALDSIIRPYSQREALGQFWLKTLDDGKYFNEDYIAHLELPGKDMMIMLTYSRIMLVKSKRLKTEWDIKLTDIQTISKERTGMSVTLKGGTNGPFIPVAEEDARNWLYKQIAVAVNAFNDRYNAKG